MPRPHEDRPGKRPLVLEQVNAPRSHPPSFVAAMKEVWAFRELLGNLVRKDLKVKYKDSVLGFLWTLVRPLLQLIVYSVAIGYFLGAGRSIPDFGIYLFTGLLAWSLFTDILNGATGSIVANAGLIKKVYFPRELFPLSVVGSSTINLLLQIPVLMIGYLFTRAWPGVGDLLLVPLALAVEIVFVSALGMLLAAANVYLRDVQYLVEVVTLLWFWMTPIVYDWTKVKTNLVDIAGLNWVFQLYMSNPMTTVVLAFQRALWPGGHSAKGEMFLYTGDLYVRLAVLLVVCSVLFVAAQRVFARVQGNFAQEL